MSLRQVGSWAFRELSPQPWTDNLRPPRPRRHTLSRRRIIPLPQWKANPETDPEALFQKEQLVLALYPQTTCFYRALIHTPPQRVRHLVREAFGDLSVLSS